MQRIVNLPVLRPTSLPARLSPAARVAPPARRFIEGRAIVVDRARRAQAERVYDLARARLGADLGRRLDTIA